MSNTCRSNIYIAIAAILFCVNLFTFYAWHKAIPIINANIKSYTVDKLKNQNKQNTINTIFSGNKISKEYLMQYKPDLIPVPDLKDKDKLKAMIPGYEKADDKYKAISEHFCPNDECYKEVLMDFYGVPDSVLTNVIAEITAFDSLKLILLLTFSTSYFLNLGWLGINCLKVLISGSDFLK